MDWISGVLVPISTAILISLVPIIIFWHGRTTSSRIKVEDRLFKLEMAQAAVSVKVDTMWQFQLRRAVTEAVTSNIATLNSPLRFDEKVLSCLNPIKDRLREAAKERPPDMSDDSFLIELERRFGQELVDQVCIPYKLSHAACLLVAMSVALDQNPLELHIAHINGPIMPDTVIGEPKS